MLRVVDESGQVLYKPDSDEVHNAATTRLLTTLAKALDPDNVRHHHMNSIFLCLS